MARIHKRTGTPVYFLTANVRKRFPLFQRFPKFADLLLRSLSHCRKKHKAKVLGFVIMPDHFHAIIAIGGTGTLQAFLRDWKGFVGHTIAEDLRKRQAKNLLKQFETRSKRKRNSRYRIFQPDTYVEGIYGRRFLQQKLRYIHNNPVVAGLAENICEYRFSSARNYYLDDDSVFQVDRLEA